MEIKVIKLIFTYKMMLLIIKEETQTSEKVNGLLNKWCWDYCLFRGNSKAWCKQYTKVNFKWIKECDRKNKIRNTK